MKIENLKFIDKNGATMPDSMGVEERKKLFPPLGIFKTIAIEWSLSDGTSHHLDLTTDDTKTSWEILPDRSGFLLVMNSTNDSTAMVINMDKTTRYVLENPLLKSEFYSDGDVCGFSYPGFEYEQLGCYAYIWSPSKTESNSGVNAEYFLVLDMSIGQLSQSHRIK